MEVIFSVVLLRTAKYAARHSFIKLSNFAVDSRLTFSEKDTLEAREDTLELDDFRRGLGRLISDIASVRFSVTKYFKFLVENLQSADLAT